VFLVLFCFPRGFRKSLGYGEDHPVTLRAHDPHRSKARAHLTRLRPVHERARRGG
jgi:hypothetical protein